MTEQIVGDFYSCPKYYDIAFSFRGLAGEVDFFEDCIRAYSGVPVRRVLELASGHSPHMPEFVRRGYQYTGIDTNEKMLAYARDAATRLGITADLRNADMNGFTLPDSVDFVYVTLGSFYVRSTADLISHFHSVAKALRPGGLYVLHWCINFRWDAAIEEGQSWKMERDGIAVEVSFKEKLVDRIEQLVEHVLTARVRENGREQQLESRGVMRAIFPQEFLLFLERLKVFEFVGWWNDADLSKPMPPTGGLDYPMTVIRRTNVPADSALSFPPTP